MGRNSIIQLENIFFSYKDKNNILNGLNFSLYEKEKVGLIAPNGSGKTTLLHMIVGLLNPSAGTIKIFGEEIKKERDFVEVRKKISLLFQNSNDSLFCPTVLEDVAFGPLNLGKSKKEATSISKKILKKLRLEGFEDKLVFNLSGGEKRLVSIAGILAMQSKVLLLDEPMTGLDKDSKSLVEDILIEEDFSYLVISHDFDFIKKVTNKVYTLEDGKIVPNKAVYVHNHPHIHKVDVPHSHDKDLIIGT